MSKKDSFIKGTIILAAAALVARVLGIFQRVPLEHLFNDVGDAAFSQANNVYLMLLTLATAGIPSTLSKMVSERYALNRPDEARQVYRAALIFGAVVGVIISAALYITAPLFAKHAGVPESTLAIRAIAPALLLFPTIAMMRGYSQGRNNMMANGISQIVEQIARVFTAILLAFFLLHQGYGNPVMAAGASFGSVFGSVGAFAIMLYAAIKMKRSDKQSGIHASPEAKLPLLGIYKDIFSLSIPIILSSMTIQAVYFIDSSLIVPLLSGQVGGTEATRLLGILGQKAQSIAGIPPVLAIALSTSLIPVISAAYARRDEVHLKRQITLAMRIAILTGTPIVLSLVVAAYSVNGLLFTSPSGSGMIALLTLGTIFQITMTTSNSILLGMGKSRISMFYVLAGIIVKLAASVLLSRFMGIYGIIIATALCFIVITGLNLRLLRSIVPFEIMGKRWRGYLLAVLVSGASGYGLNVAAISLTGMMPARLAYLVGCLAAGAVVVILYLVLLIVLGVLSAGELASYPRPVRKLLNPLMKLQPARARERE
ncbi:stage V sporulation protein B [Paenibacillus sophorae]|uniref:Polysaccharide biosynthesis protein n=1 Tax=Paenibacillus sophorae TaxID=1333845 RepID=A0A1H8UXA8_9BACL|nr:polysaccharide biosynthesis protein [Paenibacillus sophorae]QWU15345.1 polysaccharide biosynthesis protein [Paenibacillus sophorae]SEP07208.1 stage V sporulation protein B [Paenibacillus sophorae]